MYPSFISFSHWTDQSSDPTTRSCWPVRLSGRLRDGYLLHTNACSDRNQRNQVGQPATKSTGSLAVRTGCGGRNNLLLATASSSRRTSLGAARAKGSCSWAQSDWTALDEPLSRTRIDRGVCAAEAVGDSLALEDKMK